MGAEGCGVVQKGVVLTMSLWVDYAANCLWLDSTYPVNKSPSVPGAGRGTWATTSGVPADVLAQSGSATVMYGNIKVGDLGTTTGGVKPPSSGTTKAPSAAPTKVPSVAPTTKTPSAPSTKTPTSAPTKVPTKAPTTAPTTHPPTAPTKAPVTSAPSSGGSVAAY
ncbi:unnamed protein product [Aphanomyces euteiches]|uniref:cellulose 1,4-beta-cellobiosidase (non-reducing end) n=1 Tax=Aphanomyces euteiches TaxID=100861 RepID=A0A6G0WF65_9STRA|nr:hypothetical protein Ae201684_015528 [Aphanomyces euteiches]KAH9084010.1 hypothetical protein Ae201684P_020273 [Aphanomyces euteiches]KAH9148529.1 hypothetical protein AeRB84_008140 [Aphanomyces euteiches]